MRVGRAGLALALASTLLIAGCGGSTNGAGGDNSGDRAGATAPATDGSAAGPGGGQAPDPCGLLTADEVSAAVGADVLSTEGPDDVLNGRQCDWVVPHRDFGEDRVTLNVWVGAEFYAPEGPGADVTGFVPIDGVGDVAHLWPNMMGLCGVIFMQDEVVTQINLSADDDVCVDLAHLAADRL